MSYKKIVKSEEASRNAGLLAHARSVGVRRAVVEARLSKLGGSSDPVFRVDYGSGRAVIDGAGKVAVSMIADDAVGENTTPEQLAAYAKAARKAGPGQGWLHSTLADPVDGATYGTKQIGRIIIPSGLCLIVAGGGAGKTPLAHALAGFDRDSYGIVRAGEPLAGYSVDQDVIAASLGAAMFENDSVVLDSIKDLLAQGGSAMKSGISRSALVEMTAWSILAHALGVTIYAPLNPSSDDKEVVALMAEAARSNATSTITFAGGSESGSDWTYYARQGEGLPRVKASLHLATSNGVPTVSDRTSGAITSVSDRQGGLEISHLVSSSALSGALSRAVLYK